MSLVAIPDNSGASVLFASIQPLEGWVTGRISTAFRLPGYLKGHFINEFHVHGLIFWPDDICEIQGPTGWGPFIEVNSQLNAQTAYKFVEGSDQYRIVNRNGQAILTHEFVRKKNEAAESGNDEIGCHRSEDRNS